MMRFRSEWIRGISCTVAVLLLWAFATNGRAAEVVARPERASAFFIAPDEPVTLRWLAEREPDSRAQDAASDQCTLYDYAGKLLRKLPVKVDGGQLSVTLEVPRGFCELELSGTRFGLIAIEPPVGEADPFFAIDSAMSWLVADKHRRNELVDMLRLAGIGMSRERLSWSQIRPQPDRWQWDTDRGYDTLRRVCAERGVDVLEMFHDTPQWLGTVGKYPDDLVRTADDWGQIAERWQPTWGALEIWNEPDIFFGANLPADQYVAMARAVAYAVRQQSPEVPIVGGALAHDNQAFLKTAADNGLLDFVDVVSFHSYRRAAEMEPLVKEYQAWLYEHGQQDMPLWITECGRPWRRGPARPPADQDAASALDIVMKGVEARACGIARYFPFVYPCYEENEWNFGMTGREGTPLRSLAGYVQMIRALGNKRYLGDLPLSDKVVQRARAFGDEHSAVAVLYTGQAGESQEVHLPIRPERVNGIDGRELPPAADSQILVVDGLVYVWLPRAAVDRLMAGEGPRPERRLPRQTMTQRRPLSPIVLRYQFDPESVEPRSEGYRLKRTPAGRLPLRVRVFNLSAEASAVRLTLGQRTARAGETSRSSPDDGAARELTVPARSFADADFEPDLGPAIADSGQARVTIIARGPGGVPDVPLVLSFAGEASLDQVLERSPQRQRIAIDELSAWTTNIVGGGQLQLGFADGQFRMEATFGPGDRWAYPILRLDEGLDLRRYSGLVLRARCEKPATVRVMLRERAGDVVYLTANEILPADGQWHTAVVRFRDLQPSGANAPDANGRLDLDQVDRLSIGFNSQAAENRLEVSDLFAVGP